MIVKQRSVPCPHCDTPIAKDENLRRILGETILCGRCTRLCRVYKGSQYATFDEDELYAVEVGLYSWRR